MIQRCPSARPGVAWTTAIAAIAPGLTVSQMALAAAPTKPAVDRTATRSLASPQLQTPADRGVGETLPTFSWRRVAGAVRYELQVAADPAFQSPVVANARHGGIQTANTAAALTTTVADGTYYWRVRAIDARRQAGRWSAGRQWRKEWSTSPTPLSPDNAGTVDHPTAVVLRWSAVPRAYKYR